MWEVAAETSRRLSHGELEGRRCGECEKGGVRDLREQFLMVKVLRGTLVGVTGGGCWGRDFHTGI